MVSAPSAMAKVGRKGCLPSPSVRNAAAQATAPYVKAKAALDISIESSGKAEAPFISREAL
jgi:hypothetical protein